MIARICCTAGARSDPVAHRPFYVRIEVGKDASGIDQQ